MPVVEIAEQLKVGVEAEIGKIEIVRADLEAKKAMIEQIPVELAAEVAAAKLAGIEEGKAMIQLPDASDPAAQYTQEQMSAAVTAGQDLVRKELQPKLDELAAELEVLKAEVTALTEKLAQKDVELADKQAELDADKAKDAEVAGKIAALTEEIK